MTRVAVIFVLAVLVSLPATADPPDAVALAAWDRCVAAVDAQHARDDGRSLSPATGPREPLVTRIAVPGPACASPASGTIENWRGTLFVPGLTLDRLLASLHDELPSQDDVLAARFISRSPNQVRVYLRIVRRKIISVVFDTEHEMRFARRSPSLATSRSEMTKVTEIDEAGTPSERRRSDQDARGFLWRLTAYADYVEVGGGVLVRMESLTLSRSIPVLLKPVAGPIIESIGRESMRNTLEGIRRRFE